MVTFITMLTDLPPEVGVGATAILWGGAGDAYLAADEVAEAAAVRRFAGALDALAGRGGRLGGVF